MARATRFMMSISTHGGYLWKYSPDLAERAGESMASRTQIWIQPPGTPAVGMAFLNAFKAAGDPVHLEAARRAAESLARSQLGSGGWHYSGDFSPDKLNRDGLRSWQGDRAAEKNPDADKNPHYFLATTFDDNVTQGAVRFLMAYLAAAGDSGEPRDAATRACLDRALAGIVRAQYPNGGWPQRYDGTARDEGAYAVARATIPADYPRTWPGVDYTPFPTLNDDAQQDCIAVMFEAHRRYGREAHLHAAKRGIDFLLLAQLPEPQPAWAQQYGATMQPTWARAFEPPAVSSCESRSAMAALLDAYLETGDARCLAAIGPAVAWLRRSAIAPGRWSRLYELGTDRPIYGHTDGRIHYSVEEVRQGYGWQSDFHIPEFIATYDEVKRLGREEYLAARGSRSRASWADAAHARKVDRILGDLDAQGRWLSKDRFRKNLLDRELITTRTFIENLNALSRYLEAARSVPQ